MILSNQMKLLQSSQNCTQDGIPFGITHEEIEKKEEHFQSSLKNKW